MMSSLLATLALLVASGGVRLYLPSVANGLEWIGAADVRHASCRYETWRRWLQSSEPDEWSPWEIRSVQDYDSDGRGVYGISYHTSYTSTGWTDYYHGLNVRSRYDRESDGIVDQIGFNVYDAHNNHVLRRTYEGDELILVRRRFFDHENRFVREDVDEDGDGIVDVRMTREYGAIGEVLRDISESFTSGRRQVFEHFYIDGLIAYSRSLSFLPDGYLVVESESRYTLDAHNRLIGLHSVGKLNPSGGTVESVETYEYDDRGNFVYMSVHDVTRSHFYDVRYVYDDRGFMTDGFSRNYLGDLTHTRYVYTGCPNPLNNAKAEIRSFVGVVPVQP